MHLATINNSLENDDDMKLDLDLGQSITLTLQIKTIDQDIESDIDIEIDESNYMQNRCKSLENFAIVPHFTPEEGSTLTKLMKTL